MDAFMWLLFNKDSNGNSNFSIKTLDENGQPVHGLEHKVTAMIEAKNKKTILSKIFKEKWTKKRGEVNTSFTGHETIYEIDNIPVKQKEFKGYIDSILDEEIFKLITNPYYFSSLHWNKQREILMKIIGDIDNNTIIEYNSDLKELRDILDDGIDLFIKANKSKIAKLKEKVNSIPYRIDECNKAIVNYDFQELEVTKEKLSKKIQELEKGICSENYKKSLKANIEKKLIDTENQYAKEKIKVENSDIEEKYMLERQYSNLKNNIKDSSNRKESIKKFIEKIESDVNLYTSERNRLRIDFDKLSEKVLNFNNDEFICPTCLRELEEKEIAKKKKDLLENFNKNKEKKLEDIRFRGIKLNSYIKSLEKELIEYKENLEVEAKKINEYRNELLVKENEISNCNIKKQKVENEEYYIEAIKSLKEEINSLNLEKDLNFEREKHIYILEIEGLNRKLLYKESNNKLKDRIEELYEEKKDLNKSIAELENKQFLAEEFIRTKVKLLEERINLKFKNVKFKLFEEQVNGGIQETCKAVVNGVPYYDVNTAGKVNAGLDIINTLCEYYNISAPIFIDNRESVNTLIPVNSQIVNLIVNDEANLSFSKSNELLNVKNIEVGENSFRGF